MKKMIFECLWEEEMDFWFIIRRDDMFILVLIFIRFIILILEF